MFLFGGTALCVVGTPFMSGRSPRIPLALLGPDSCRCSKSSASVFGSAQTLCLALKLKESLSGSHSFTGALWHPSIQAIENHGNKKPFILRSSIKRSCLFLALLLFFFFALLHYAGPRQIETGRVGPLIGLQGD